MRVRAPELVGREGWIGADGDFGLAALRGKVVVLHFWTSACINCLRSLDDLRDLGRRFPGEVAVVGIHSPKYPHETDHDVVRRAVARHRVGHPVLDDPDMVTWQQYGVRGWPTFVVIDPRGYVEGALAGEGNGPLLHQIVGDLVAHHRDRGRLRTDPVPVRPVEEPPGLLAFPAKVATDRRGRLAIADTGHDRVLVADLVGGSVARLTHVIGGLHQPHGVRLYGSDLVICDTGADRVVLVDLARRPGPEESVTPDAAGIIRLRVLPGEVVAADLASPWDVTADADRSLVVAEAGRHRLWRIPRDGSSAAVIAGDCYEGLHDGPAEDAELAQPSGLARLPNGIAFVDAESSSLRLLSNRGKVGTVVGEGMFDWGLRDGRASTARLQHPRGVAASLDGTALYVADTFNSKLRWWRDRRLVTLAHAPLCEPGGLDVLPDGRLVVADTGNHRVVIVDPETGATDTLSFESIRLPDQEAAPTWGEALDAAAGSPLVLPFAVDLAGYRLELSDDLPVRVTVHAEPAWLLEPGPTAWGHDRPCGELHVRAGAAGSGSLTVTVAAAACSEGLSTTRKSATHHPLVVR